MKNKLFWKISATLLGILLLLGVAYSIISVNSARQYFLETNQKLYGDIAEHTVKEVQPLINGNVDTNAIKDIMHSMMVINPSVEVYLLDTDGKIITYVAPYKKVVLEKVDLAPVDRFIARSGHEIVLGDDPRHPDHQNIFSAARIEKDGKTEGYVYVILASEESADVTETLLSSFILKTGVKLFFLTLTVALLIGLLAIWLITKNLNAVMEVVRRFKDGDYQARVPHESASDMQMLGSTFNEMAETISSNIENIQSVENLRKELIANVSHDLRTPLSIMKGYVETLQLKGQTLTIEEKDQYLNIIANSTENLSKLVSQLFEYSKLEANEITPLKEPFSITDLAQDTFQNYQMILKERQIELDLQFADQSPIVYADVSLIERVIQNLMDNAIKFTPSGGTITVGVIADKDIVEFNITDSGPGIPANEQKYIFERFKQAKTIKEKKEGAGLGLAIAKKIMDVHASILTVKSEPNHGASFMFQLPRHQVAVQ